VSILEVFVLFKDIYTPYAHYYREKQVCNVGIVCSECASV